MKKAYIYLTFIVMAVLAVACSKNGSQVDPDPTKPAAPKEANIGFGSASAKAPGALEADAAKPLQVRVYDYYTATTETEYINDLIQEATTAGAWAFVSENEYAWKKGAHKFLGWVEKDEAGTAVPNLSYADKVLSVGTAAAPVAAADYRYAELVTVNWPDNTMIEVVDGKSVAKPVSLNVKHLTSALTFTVKDYSYVGDVVINSISIGDVKTKGSATIDYSGDAQAVTLSLGDETGAVSFPLPATTPFTRESDDDPGVFNGDTTCVWPQAYEGLKMTVNYTPTGHDQITATVDIPDGEWEAGKVYNFDIQIVNKNIVLVFKVQPWDASEEAGEIDTAEGSINMSNVTWMNAKLVVDGSIVNTVSNSGFAVMMYYKPSLPGPDDDPSSATPYTAFDYYPAQGYFTVNYPVAGLFKIELIPAYGQTEADLDASKYEIWIYDNSLNPSAFRAINPDGEAITNDTVYFQVRAAAGQDGAEHKAQINIWFKPDGQDEWISAYSEIRANYALVIPATS